MKFFYKVLHSSSKRAWVLIIQAIHFKEDNPSSDFETNWTAFDESEVCSYV